MKQVTVVPGNKAVPFSHLDFPHASLLSNIKHHVAATKALIPPLRKKKTKPKKQFLFQSSFFCS